MNWLTWICLIGNIMQAIGLLLILKAHRRDERALDRELEVFHAAAERQIAKGRLREYPY